jgi:hypothetical protein
MGKLLDKIQKDMTEKSLEARTTESRTWLLTTLRNLNNIDRKRQIINDKERMVTRAIIGKMYFFFYDPKTKDDLPYYDRFPLVIPIKQYSDGFLGLNLHYLPPRYRIRFLDKLYNILNNENFDETTKFKISYRLLDGIGRFKEFRPCLKRYLKEHIKTRMVNVTSNEWEIAAVLPVEFFAKEKNKNNIFKESVERIKNGI